MSASTTTTSILHLVLNDILKVVSPSQKDWDLRFAFLADLRKVVDSVQSLEVATVEPFGSFVSNLFTRWDDLDISVVLSNSSHISFDRRKHEKMLLGDLLRALKMEGGWSNLKCIFNARFPILRFKSNEQGKEMGFAHRINNYQVGTLNSYVLTLLVIFHFQTCVPAILPPLKDIYPGNMVYDLRGVRTDAEKFIAQTCDANITRFLSDESREINRKSLPELFVEFLRKFSQMDSWASKLGICPYTGQWERIKDNMMWFPKTCAIFVEDPFELSTNAGKFLNTEDLRKISQTFLKTYKIVTSKNQSQSSLLCFLTTENVSRLIRTPCVSGYIDEHYCRTLPMQPHPHFQQWSRNGNIGRNRNNPASRKPKQGQRIWRPDILVL